MVEVNGVHTDAVNALGGQLIVDSLDFRLLANVPSKSSMVFSSLATDLSANSARVSA